MKILRVELESGLSRKFFEIPVDKFNLDDLLFFKNSVNGEISSNRTNDGYHLRGRLSIPFIETCDRCLTEFQQETESTFDIILTKNEEIAEDNGNYDVLFFPANADFIDLTEIFHDLICLEEPFKKICKEDCKGLCANCGTDLNVSSCDCHIEKTNSIWEKLKELK